MFPLRSLAASAVRKSFCYFIIKVWKERPLNTLPFIDYLANPRWQWRVQRWQRKARSFFDDVRNPGRGSGALTKSLIFLNLIFFTLMILQGTAAGLGMRPLLNPDPYLLIHAGAQYWPLVLVEGEWWRCITYAFTHGGLIHLAFNMVVLYQVGPLLEFEVGAGRYLFLYTLTALTATIAGYFWHPAVPVVGASGSLFGLIGFAVVYTDDVLRDQGGVDILINNAGRSIRRSLKLSTDRPHDFERTIELNYLAPVRLVLAFLPGMRDRGFGHVINVLSQHQTELAEYLAERDRKIATWAARWGR
jgi:membrane associated rhomboid family serine protease